MGGTFISNTVTGGAGLSGGVPAYGGGTVGNGGGPGSAGGGGEGGGGLKTQGPGGDGATASRGGNGATGAAGGAGGDSLGGAIYNAGNAQLCNATFTSDGATSGAGGWGSPGGAGGDGGIAGLWGLGDPQGPPGSPGDGGNGGNGSNGAESGTASGGAVYSSASLDWSELSFSGDSVTSGAAGEAGPGGSAGPGGPPLVEGRYPAGHDGQAGTAGQAGKQGPATGPNLVEGSLTAKVEGSRRAHALTGSARSSTTTPCNEVVVAPTSQNLIESGLSWPASPGPVGFITDVPDQDFLQSCLSGCRNFVVWVKEAGGSQGIANAKVTVKVSPITGTSVINPAQGGGYVCQVAFILNNRDGACGNPLTVTTDSSGGAEGKVYLRYYPPAIYLGDKATPPTATITATTSSCGNSCSTVNGTTDVRVGPHLIYQMLGVGLSWQQKQALISWARPASQGGGNITKNLGPIDKTFSYLSKLYENNKKLKNLSKALGDLAKVTKLYGTWADYGMLLWFQQTFGVVNDGLVHLGSVQTLVSKILSYVKDPILNKVVTWLNNKLFKVHTYTDEVLKMLRDYANTWLWTDETNHDTQVMNVKLFEASYCTNSICRSLAPDNGIHYNLLVTFSSQDFTQTKPYFKNPNVDTAYAAPTWIPAQCASIPANHRTKLCGGGP